MSVLSFVRSCVFFWHIGGCEAVCFSVFESDTCSELVAFCFLCLSVCACFVVLSCIPVGMRRCVCAAFVLCLARVCVSVVLPFASSQHLCL